MAMTWGERRKQRSATRVARRIRKAEDALDDAEAYLSKWGFSMAPSEKRRRREDIEALELRLDVLTLTARGITFHAQATP